VREEAAVHRRQFLQTAAVPLMIGHRRAEAADRGAPVYGSGTGVRRKGGEWTTLGRDLVPDFGVTTGIRRTGHGLDHEHRRDVSRDTPLNHPGEVRRSGAVFRSDRVEGRTDVGTTYGLLDAQAHVG
jgi:hypothetical protein